VVEISNAPSPVSRIMAMAAIHRKKFVTIEPILDFDVPKLYAAIISMNPEFVNIGADSKHHNLSEPTPDKVHALIAKLNNEGVEIREKHNLERLL
jgi:hypothetical protein